MQEKRKWVDPIKLANLIPDKEEYWTLLYSGLRTDYSGNFSFLAINPKKEIKSEKSDALREKLTSNKNKFSDSWFGYLGYGLKNTLEKLPKDKKSYIHLPALWMLNYSTILVFNHSKKQIQVWSEKKFDFDHFFHKKNKDSSIIKISSINSNMSKSEYIEKVKKIKNAIINGDLYQANLTRKFYGNFNKTPSASNLFKKLCDVSPSPYSCLLRLKDNYLISSSPERFLTIDNKGNVETRPIKGTVARNKNPNKDKALKEKLKDSAKDKSENLMIVDLMRNDLSKSCKPGTVKVKSLFDINSYSTVHHMSSTITGVKKPGVKSLDLVLGSFPPGSMTGTPKIKAMEMCSKLEKQERGVYSGAIGWFGGDGSADLSVVIRTLIIQGNKFEFQVGGAIVADSMPKMEFDETISKAAAIINVLGIKKSEIKNI